MSVVIYGKDRRRIINAILRAGDRKNNYDGRRYKIIRNWSEEGMLTTDGSWTVFDKYLKEAYTAERELGKWTVFYLGERENI